MLDPSDDRPGSRGHGSWLQLALSVDRLRQTVASQTLRLPAVPTLPAVYFGFARKECAAFEVTPALMRIAKNKVAVEWQGRDLDQLARGLARAQDRAFARLSEQDQQELLRRAWEESFIAPADKRNDTGYWLLPHELATNVFGTTRIFEYFAGMVGSLVFNPAACVRGKAVRNPAAEVAREAGFDLVADLASLANTAEGSPEYEAIEQRLIELVPRFRAHVGASNLISDQDLLNAICHYEQPVMIRPPLDTLPASEQVRLMREQLAPHISECCTDDNLLTAARSPNSRLMASGLCRVQTLHLEVGNPLSESLTFESEELGRERVRAVLWHGHEQRRAQMQSPLVTTKAVAA